MPLVIDSEFQSLLKPLDEETRLELERMIAREGVLLPLLYWRTGGQNILVDGHHRKDIAERLGVGFETKSVEFPSREEAIQWIKEHQANRRNLSENEVAVLRGREYNSKKQSPKERAKAGGKGKNSALCQPGTKRKPDEKPRRSTKDEVARAHGVSARTVVRDGIRAEIHDEAAKVDEEAAAVIVELSQPVVEAISQGTRDE